MQDKFFETIKQATYFNWEIADTVGTLEHICCVEEIVAFLEGSGITEEDQMIEILKCGKEDLGYVAFVREIAYRLFIYSYTKDPVINWISAETLLGKAEWRLYVARASKLLSENKNNTAFISSLHSKSVKNLYLL